MTIDLICLGVGGGVSYVMKGKNSSSLALLIDGQPKLLIDCGAGVARAAMKYLDGIIPDQIYISHNHLDHTGDLPIVLAVQRKLNKRRSIVYGHQEVLDIVKKYRMHEMLMGGTKIEEWAKWTVADAANRIELADGLSLQLVHSIHSYVCYGFILYHHQKALLGYTADSDFDAAIYDTLAQAPIVIVDGREKGNHDHASFAEIEQYAQQLRPECQLYVTHYEESDYQFEAPQVELLEEGQRINLL